MAGKKQPEPVAEEEPQEESNEVEATEEEEANEGETEAEAEAAGEAEGEAEGEGAEAAEGDEAKEEGGEDNKPEEEAKEEETTEENAEENPEEEAAAEEEQKEEEETPKEKFEAPLGPLFMNPKPVVEAALADAKVMKVAALKSVVDLFPEFPLRGAYGDKDDDVEAYLEVGVEADRVFKVTPGEGEGDLKQVVCQGSSEVEPTYKGHVTALDDLYPKLAGCEAEAGGEEAAPGMAAVEATEEAGDDDDDVQA